MKKTQTEIILDFIKSEGEEGVHPSTLAFECKITQYNARIHEVRESFGCTHRHSDVCQATEHIINKKLPNGTTIFVYKKTANPMAAYYEEHQAKQKEEVEQEGLF